MYHNITVSSVFLTSFKHIKHSNVSSTIYIDFTTHNLKFYLNYVFIKWIRHIDLFDFVPQKYQTESLNRLIIDEMYSSHCQCDLHF